MNIDELKPGIWYIGKIKDGIQFSHVAEKQADLPEVMDTARFLPLKSHLYKALTAFFRKKEREGAIIEGVTSDEILEVVETAIKQGKRLLKKNVAV
jgi:hypothetical protein